jgi:hypothetical protein
MAIRHGAAVQGSGVIVDVLSIDGSPQQKFAFWQSMGFNEVSSWPRHVGLAREDHPVCWELMVHWSN